MEILTNLQKKILTLFSSVPDSQAFYFTGGTALSAFFLKHRKSNDLDFFSGVEELILPFSRGLEMALKHEGCEIEPARRFRSFVELSIKLRGEESLIHLALDSPFRFESSFDSKEFPGLKVDSLVDMAANKLLSLFGRAAFRDFIDVYFLVKDCFKKEDLVEKAKQKDPGFDLYWLGVAMERIKSFPEDAPDMYLLVRPCKMTELQEFYANWRREISKVILEDT